MFYFVDCDGTLSPAAQTDEWHAWYQSIKPLVSTPIGKVVVTTWFLGQDTGDGCLWATSINSVVGTNIVDRYATQAAALEGHFYTMMALRHWTSGRRVNN